MSETRYGICEESRFCRSTVWELSLGLTGPRGAGERKGFWREPQKSGDICCFWWHAGHTHTACRAHSGNSLIQPVVGGATWAGGKISPRREDRWSLPGAGAWEVKARERVGERQTDRPGQRQSNAGRARVRLCVCGMARQTWTDFFWTPHPHPTSTTHRGFSCIHVLDIPLPFIQGLLSVLVRVVYPWFYF